MSKKVLILSGSPRKGGNSDLLCDEFLRGAIEAGHEAEKIFIRGGGLYEAGSAKGSQYMEQAYNMGRSV